MSTTRFVAACLHAREIVNEQLVPSAAKPHNHAMYVPGEKMNRNRGRAPGPRTATISLVRQESSNFRPLVVAQSPQIPILHGRHFAVRCCRPVLTIVAIAVPTWMPMGCVSVVNIDWSGLPSGVRLPVRYLSPLQLSIQIWSKAVEEPFAHDRDATGRRAMRSC